MINSWQTITRGGCVRKAWKPPPRDPFQYILNLEASLHLLLSFAWTLTRPTNFNSLRQNIVFSNSERILVSFSWLFYYFSFFFCYFTLLLTFTKNYFIMNNFFFLNFFFIFSCSGMFRHVPACSGLFRVPGFIDGRFSAMLYHVGLSLSVFFAGCFIITDWVIYRSKIIRMKCGLNWSCINHGELHWHLVDSSLVFFQILRESFDCRAYFLPW